MNDIVRIIDGDGRFCGRTTEEKASRYVGTGKAKLEGNGKKQILRLHSKYRLEDFDECPSSSDGRYHYRESIGDHEFVVLKRNTEEGFKRWDNDLTFEELRRGLLRKPTRIAKDQVLIEVQAA
jgi:hypothetical protein